VLYSPHHHKKYSAGWIKSNRKSHKITEQEELYQSIDRGIHTYRTLRRAKIELSYWDNGNDDEYIIMPVKCDKKDFVAVGHGEAVFTKVFIRKADYLRVIKNHGK